MQQFDLRNALPRPSLWGLLRKREYPGPAVGKNADREFMATLTKKFFEVKGYPVRFTARNGAKEWQADIVLYPLRRTPRALFDANGLSAVNLGLTAAYMKGIGSAYAPRDGAVYVFPEVLGESAEVWLNVATHELGHALFEHYLRTKCWVKYSALRNEWQVLRTDDGAALYAANMGGIAERAPRKKYQADTFEEFLAEVYMLYLLHHILLWRHIEELDFAWKKSWLVVWKILEEVLGPWQKPWMTETPDGATVD